MKSRAFIINITQIVLITAMSGAGAYAFYASSAYGNVMDYGRTHDMGFMPYLPLIIWGAAAAFGILNIFFRGRGSGTFTWLVTIFSLPSLLGQNTVDWPGITGMDFKLTTNLGFAGTAATGIFVITGYIVLNYLRMFKQYGNNLASRGATQKDIEGAGNFSFISLLSGAGAGIIAAVLVALLARNLELLTLGFIRGIPWNVVFIGLFCLLALAFYLYWLGARRRGDNTTNTTNVK